MMHTLVGRAGFAARHEPVLRAPRRPGRDLRRLSRKPWQTPTRASELQRSTWSRSSAGTRRPARRGSTARGRYDAHTSRTYTLGLEQQQPGASPGEADEAAPRAAGDTRASSGATVRPLPLQLEDEPADDPPPSACWCCTEARSLLHLRQPRCRTGTVAAARLLGARARWSTALSDADLLTLLNFDSDPFNRWEAGQRLALNGMLLAAVNGTADAWRRTASSSPRCAACCATAALDPSFKELVLTPAQRNLLGRAALESLDPQRVHAAREALQAEDGAGAARRLGLGVRGAPGQAAATRPTRSLPVKPCPGQSEPWPCCALTPPRATTRCGPAVLSSASRTPPT